MENHCSDQSSDGCDNTDCQRIDKYGFELPEDYESGDESEYISVLARRSKKWSKLLKGTDKVEKSLKVKRYVRKGVPCERRTQIWMAASGAQDQLEAKPGYYHSLLKAEHDSRMKEAIHADLHRTFPDNIQFRDSSQTCLQRALFNVLLAYGHHNKDVGYCQLCGLKTKMLLASLLLIHGAKEPNQKGMNFIAGYLLIITKDEEKSFWLMDALVGKILPDYYTPTMLGLKTDQEVLGELVRMKCPAVWQTMNQHNVMWTLVVSRWFICLFVDILPVETVMRIWDCLFYEGSKILFRVALTLIRQHQVLISQATSLPDICQRFKESTQGEYVENCHNFMQKIFLEPGALSMGTVTKLREMCRNRVVSSENPPH